MNNLNKYITILGSGESGIGAALLGASKDYDVFVSDAKIISDENLEILEKRNISYEQNGHSLDKMLQSEFVIKSPGIPENAEIVLQLKGANISVISEIEFASKFTNAKFIAITGSNGKTTTTLLTYHILKSAGLKVGMAGNVGNSLSKLILENSYDLIVVELSSFQLDGMFDFKADLSVLLNITADHLDRYDYDLTKYAEAKFRVFQNQEREQLCIYNVDDNLVKRKLGNSKLEFGTLGISVKDVVEHGAYLSNNKLVFDYKEKSELETDDIPLIGKHNYYNVMAAGLIALQYGVDFETIKSAISTFKNAAHRLEFIADVDGVRFINDSKATNVDSVYYALDSLERSVIWVAGGVNKGNDYSILRNLVKQKVKTIVCLGVDNQHLFDAFENDVEIIKETLNADEAVSQAFALAIPGDVVLLSPACASFDLFKNYEARGNEFKSAVLYLKKKRELMSIEMMSIEI